MRLKKARASRISNRMNSHKTHPVPVGFRQARSAYPSFDHAMVNLPTIAPRHDSIVQDFLMGNMDKDHHDKLLSTGEAFYSIVLLYFFTDFVFLQCKEPDLMTHL